MARAMKTLFYVVILCEIQYYAKQGREGEDDTITPDNLGGCWLKEERKKEAKKERRKNTPVYIYILFLYISYSYKSVAI